MEYNIALATRLSAWRFGLHDYGWRCRGLFFGPFAICWSPDD